MAVNRNKNKYKQEIVLITNNHFKVLDSVLLKKKMYRKLLDADLVVQINKNPPQALCCCKPSIRETALNIQSRPHGKDDAKDTLSVQSHTEALRPKRVKQTRSSKSVIILE